MVYRLLMCVAAFVAMMTAAMAQRSVGFVAAPQPGDALIVATKTAEPPKALGALVGLERLADVRRAIVAAGFTGEAGQTASLNSGLSQFGEIHLIGVGAGEMRARDWEDFGGRAGALARLTKTARIAVIADGAGAAGVQDAALGAMLGQYSFDLYKSEPVAVAGALLFVAGDPNGAKASFDSGRRHKANAVNWVRDMQSEPANVLYPEEFVRRATAQFKGVANVSIRVIDEREMKSLGMGAILGVGQGSPRPPRIMIVRYDGGPAGAAPIVFAGKGITFDSGGISIKQNAGMWMMKADMTGAAAVMGAAMSLSKSRAPVNVIAVAALAENMPDGGAQRPGDVVRTMSGRTVEIMSTDAEGRLVLSDAVWFAQKNYHPSLLVDIATLTGSVGRALGDEYAGLFSRSDEIAAQLIKAGDQSGEDLWRLPLHPNHNKQIASFIADVKNGDTGDPGASTGAAFIGYFILPETPWAHLDIAGVDWREEATPTAPLDASGYGVRLLDRLARDVGSK
ncbi:MAG: leucyl aminopeptidase [Parvularculaceae bacterium]